MKIVVWLYSIDNTRGGGFQLLVPAINVLNNLYENINVLGAVTPQGMKFNELPAIDKNDLKTTDFDLILVTGHDIEFADVLNQAEVLGINAEKIIMDRTVCVPNFTLDKYKKLRRSRISIFSKNCWGGWIHHRFGLPFLSPTINLFMYPLDFLKFLENPRKYLAEDPHFLRTAPSHIPNTDYPIFSLGGVEIFMNHYFEIASAKNKWLERSKRVNWYNLLVEMCTDDIEILKQFDKLPYAKKFCFVPFKSDIDSAVYVDFERFNDPAGFEHLVSASAMGAIDFYDPWDMLLYGKKTPLIIQ